ncbi:hypothetical protein R1sor_023969 [Riccia sorocarpa]|uniref:CCHC-type domain-containing protein n=1 Tax=Riccia sorocarpa TaxID=122646 RepID=A0ABD3GPB6_9MARC
MVNPSPANVRGAKTFQGGRGTNLGVMSQLVKSGQVGGLRPVGTIPPNINLASPPRMALDYKAAVSPAKLAGEQYNNDSQHHSQRDPNDIPYNYPLANTSYYDNAAYGNYTDDYNTELTQCCNRLIGLDVNLAKTRWLRRGSSPSEPFTFRETQRINVIRSCMLMDLNKSLPEFIPIAVPEAHDKVMKQRIRYLRLPDACFNCRQRDHFVRSCPLEPNRREATRKEPDGGQQQVKNRQDAVRQEMVRQEGNRDGGLHDVDGSEAPKAEEANDF